LFLLNSTVDVDGSDLNIIVRDINNAEIKTGLDEISVTPQPLVFELSSNHPNPFNPTTKISFSLPEKQDVRLKVFGIDGRCVTTLVDESRGAGFHEVIWNGRNDAGQTVASGTYFYRIEAGPYSQVRKMSLMK